MKCQMSMSIYDSKQKRPALHTSERTIVPRTVIFIVDTWLSGLLSRKIKFPLHKNLFLLDKVLPESGSGAFFVVKLLMLQLRVFLGRKCRIYALFLSRISRLRAFWGGIFGRNLSEILRNTQNFGRNSEEKIGHWSLCCHCSTVDHL